MAEDTFARLVSLACHDLRTPLATVRGFARTLARMDDLADPASTYAAMIESAVGDLGELIEQLSLVARIESGRYAPTLREVSTAELARVAAEQLGAERVRLSGQGGPVRVDVVPAGRAISALARCALRHGGVEAVDLEAEGEGLVLSPVTAASGPVVLGEDLRDLGAAAGVRVIRALGGSLALEGGALSVRLPR